MLNLSSITRRGPAEKSPEHHVISASTAQSESGWASYIPSWAPSPGRSRPSLSDSTVAGFRNPWPSWHRPTAAEKWNSFQWGEDDDGCIELAASRLVSNQVPHKPPKNMRPTFPDLTTDWPNSIGAKAARLLQVEKPDFSFPTGSRAKATWLGHAGVLLQLPSPEGDHGRPVTAIFDPLFGARCSPSQFAGPIRSYPPPCQVQDLPPIDLVLISHNHFDHMDAGSIQSIWYHSRDSVRFFVPLGNKKYLLEWGISADRIVEMDWWESADFTVLGDNKTLVLRVHCTPAQHNSFRSVGDTNNALWSSWLLESFFPGQNQKQQKPYRVFFGGDTGYQFHPDPSWPPSPNHPPSDRKEEDNDETEEEKFPACPAFAEIRARIAGGAPLDLLLLPVSVGATFAYLRSFVPLPNRINPFPRHSAGVTAANHMPPWDAVRVLREISDDGGETGKTASNVAPVAVAMHWGTFVTDPEEVLKTLGALEFACQQQGVKFARQLQRGRDVPRVDDEERKPVFVALNHGGSVSL
ncbi:beta-lactamase superfamily domain-containing protein [Corynascus similis CBS 632.67]